MTEVFYRKESYDIVSCLYQVHNNLGNGFLEIVYKDALEYEFRSRGIQFQREKEYCVKYKDVTLPHKFYADFVIYDKIILEIKSIEILSDTQLAQCINYLKVSQCKLAILANFKHQGLEYKRIVL